MPKKHEIEASLAALESAVTDAGASATFNGDDSAPAWSVELPEAGEGAPAGDTDELADRVVAELARFYTWPGAMHVEARALARKAAKGA